MVFEKIKAFFGKVAGWFKSLTKKQLWITIICSVLAIATFTAVIAIASCDPEEEKPGPEQTTYTVTFETNGGSEIDAITVTEGAVLKKPTDPQLTGSEFVGWYSDSTFKNPFYFDSASAKITSNLTLYARWEVPAGEMEYVIDFNTGVEGLSYDSIKTINSKVFAGRLPVAVRSGYTFAGWAISMYDDADKLSYMWEDAMTVAENVTFHALWVDNASTKLATPVVNVTASGISWKAITGVSTYHVTVAGPVGFEAIATNTGSTTQSIDFTTAPVGEYEIIVTAVASDTTKNSEPAVRNYINKALSRVSYFEVDGTTVSFNAVANATDYLLTVVCGDSNHNHTEMSLNGQTQYDFANCLTTSGKVSFAVTSYAEGYVSVTSRVYNYTKALDAVTGIAVDEATGKISWNAVEKAEKYVVTVDCGNAAHDHDKVVVGDTQFDLKECEAKDGGINVSVYAVAATYGDSAPATYNYEKTALATPGSVKMSGTTLLWNAVNGATGGYKVKIGDETIDVDTNSIDLSAQQIAWVEANDYVIQLQAIGADGEASLWSDDIDARYYAMYTSVSYNEGYVTWNHVIGATAYKVKVNDGAEVTIDGKNYAPITLTQAGENTISVCYTDGTNTSDWVSTTVEAYAVEFDTKASTTFATQYKAVGDPTDSFYSETVQKPGYNFYGWYTSEEVGAGNAELYQDLYFRTAESIKLYADYTPKSYEIVYDYGDGGVGSATTAKVTFGKHYQLAVPQPTGESVFEGWYTAPNGKGMPLTDENGISIDPWSVAIDESGSSNIVYAYWNDLVLDFKETKVSGSNAIVYSVSKGARINTVDHVVVPETYKGRPVKIVAAHAFLDCTKLKRISIPNTVEQIFTSGATAFDGCLLLEEINIIPVEGNKAIRYWSKDGVLFDNGRLDEQDGTVEVAAFPMNYKSTTYRIPEGVSHVPTEAFENSMLEEIIFSPDITLIETRGFYNAKLLKKLTFEDPAEGEGKPLEIEDRAFESCTALEIVNLPARLSSIQTKKYEISGKTVNSGPAYENITTSNSASVSILDSFYGCSKLKALNVAEGGETYSSKDGVLFNKNQTTILYAPKYFEPKDGVYTVPNGVTKIEAGAFLYCSNIEELYIPSTVTDIGEYAFYNCYNTEKITFGGNGFNDVSIGKYAFRSCYYAEIVFEPNSRVTTIGEGAFMYNYEIKKLTIPATVTQIGNIAFRGWSYLDEVVFEDATKADATLAFGDGVFYGTKIETLNIPAHASQLGGIFNGMDKLKTIVVDPDNEYYTTVSGILYNSQKTEMLYWPQDLIEGYTLPDTLETIGAGIFKGNVKLETFEIPNTVKTIGQGAFQNSMIKTLTFKPGNDENALTIGEDAFRDCDRLSSLALPKRTQTIGTYALSSMDALQTLTLAEGLTAIGDYAIYQNDNLQSLAVPDSVKTIGYYGIGKNAKLQSITFGQNSQLEEIGAWGLANNTAMQSIELPASLKYLRYYSLHQGSSSSRGKLNSITFATGSQLEIIEAYAMYYLDIKQITIPKTVKEIGYYAFAYSELETIDFEKGGTENLTIGMPMTYETSSSGSKSTSYGYAFAYCDNLKKLVLPARATQIGQYSFVQNYALQSVKFEEGKSASLQFIGDYAFRNCTSLEYFFFPKSMTNIGSFKVGTSSTVYYGTAIGKLSFWGCTALSEAIFEQGGNLPMTIGEGAFYDCSSLTEVNLPSRLVTYTSSLDNKEFAPLGPVVNVNNASMMFGNCTSLKTVNVVMNTNDTPYLDENELVSEDGVVFSADMKELIHLPVGREKAYEIPNTVEKIGPYAIARAKKIKSITFEEGNDDVALVIGESAFMQCISLESISLAKRVSSIEPYAFQKCTALASVDLSTNLAAFDATVFDGCANLAAVNAAPDSTRFSSVNGVLFNAAASDADLHTLYYYPASKTDKVYAVPASVKTIFRYAFYDNVALEEIILPEGLLAIDDYAFYNATGLKTVCIRKNVTNIGDYAFYNCTALENLTFEEGGTAPLTIGNANYINTSKWGNSATSTSYTYNGSVFAYCYSLENVTLPARTKVIVDNAFHQCLGLKSINIPQNVEQLGRGAFRNCERLETVAIDAAAKFTVIPVRLFENCYSLKSIVIPASVTEFEKDKPNSGSTAQSNAFAFCLSLETVEFADGCQIEALANGLFAGCQSLESIVIPASVLEIANGGSSYSNYGVFYNCKKLNSITFEEGSAIEYIGSYAFYQCEALETFEIPATVTEMGSSVFGKCYSLDNVVFPEDVYIDDSTNMFLDCTSLTTVTLPESMSILPYAFFQGCSSLTEFEIPETISEVYDGVFAGTAITSVTVRTGVYYEYYAFGNMDSLVEIIFEDGVDSIADEMFSGCASLVSVVIPDSVSYIGYYAFGSCDSLESIVLPNNEDFTYLSDEIVESCPNLKTIEIPQQITEIGYMAFYNSGITSIQLPANLETIWDEAFESCENLKSITIPKSVSAIEYYAFQYCTSLEEVIFEDGSILDTLADNVFSDCPSLKTIVLPDTITSISSTAFNACTSLESINIPEMCTNVDFRMFYGCRSLNEINIHPNNEAFVNVNGIIMNNAQTEILLCLPQKTGSYTIPEDVTIRDGAFMNSNLDEIVLPASLKTIPKYWFSGISADTVFTIPNGVETIGEYAFAYGEFTTINIPASVISIGKYAFTNCDKLTTINIADGDKRLSIGANAFENCTSLDNVVIPSRVRLDPGITSSTYAVGAYSFRNCTSLKNISFAETPEENGVEGVLNFGTEAFANCTALEEIELPKAFGDGYYDTSTVYAMYSKVFYNCTSLSSVTFNAVEGRNISLGSNNFEGCTSLTAINLPSTVVYLGGKVFANTGLTSIVIPESVVSFGTAYGYYYDQYGAYKYTSMGRYFENCLALQSITVRASATNIPLCAFDNLPALQSIVFETDTITTIGECAFANCTAVTEITLPTSVTAIGVNAFLGWTASQTVNVNKTLKQCNMLTALWLKGNDANFVYLPEA